MNKKNIIPEFLEDGCEHIEFSQFEKKFNMFRSLAEQGVIDAPLYYAPLHLRVLCTGSYHVETIEWLKRAAEMGLSMYQYYLAIFYLQGTGIGKDYNEAVKWFRKAAEQGHAFAQYYLGNCYENGKGIEQNDVV